MADQHDIDRGVGRSDGPRRPLKQGMVGGSMNYIPTVKSNKAGDLDKAGIKNQQTPHFHQVTPFMEWVPPVRAADAALTRFRPSRTIKAQKSWLQRSYPDAIIADTSTRSLVRKELLDSKPRHAPAAPANTACLLATGEIHDMRVFKQNIPNATCKAIAVAAGESGSSLRLICLVRQDWGWPEQGVEINLNVPHIRQEAEWHEDGYPISSIKFVCESTRYNPTRWLIVQKATSTTVLKPELGERLLGDTEPSRNQPSPHASRVFIEPLFTIRSSQTGGSSHSDVYYNPASDRRRVPQLAIIDYAGFWSVWDIEGNRRLKGQRLLPTMRMCGNILNGSISAFPYKTRADDQEPHRILGLSLDDDELHASMLLLCNSTAISLFDSQTTTLRPVTQLVIPKKRKDRILDIAPCPLNPSQAFILTTAKLLWVSATKDTDGNPHLEHIISCSHRIGEGSVALKLEVSHGTHVNDREACFVYIRPASSSDMTVFSFLNSAPGQPARYERTIIRLEAPLDFIGVGILPVFCRVEPNSKGVLSDTNARLFQLVILGKKLDVRGSLCVWSDKPNLDIPPPKLVSGRDRELDEERAKLARWREEIFSVPDELDERLLVRVEEEKIDYVVELFDDDKDEVPEHSKLKVPLRYISMAVKPVTSRTRGIEWPQDEVDTGIVADAIEQETRGGLMPRHSLLDLVGRGRTAEDLLLFASEWTRRKEQLVIPTEEQLVVSEGSHGPHLADPDGFVKTLKTTLPRPQSDNANALQRGRRHLLQHIAAETLLSNVGISALPQDWQLATTASQRSQRAISDAAFSSSLPFSSSSPLLSSQVGSQSQGRATQLSLLGSQSQSQSLAGEGTQNIPGIELRKFAPMNPEKLPEGRQSLFRSTWDPSGNAADGLWRIIGDDEEEEAALKRKRRIEAKRRRAERLKARLFSDPAEKDKPATASQAMPDILVSSQPRARSQTQAQSWVESSSQIPMPKSSQMPPMPRSSQVLPSQVRSQIVSGIHGGRATPKKAKAKKGGFR
ncbi:RNA polymerase I-specific transcription-initiation factor-domain-containing protein [Bombardia bombarda]|uniref:RNA polymerase I-specific transcription-initiation factor-domain-containing protein n=1 Tax=Bombardia bombarda TaxID=252184 RepID=A0AA39XJ79_9PEZI|nr:RNA polymerase I-specific transcription-initiation factor-domain-containing protein [Bombardia bombarda]